MASHSDTLRIAAGRVEITPRRPVPLAGYRGRAQPIAAVRDALEANALVLRQGGRIVALVSFDLLYVGERLRAAILERLDGRLASDDLMLAASHTHYAPATDANTTGVMDTAFIDDCAEAVALLVTDLMASGGRPGRLRYAEGAVPLAVNRRLKRSRLGRAGIQRKVLPGPNPTGECDATARVVVVEDELGRPLAILWNWACHPIYLPTDHAMSAAYAGTVRRHCRASMAATDLPVVFLQGFAGDVDPRSIGRVRSPSAAARRVLQGPRFGLFDEDGWARWSGTLSERVAALARAAGAPLKPSLASVRREHPLSLLVEGARETRTVAVQRIRLAEGLSVVALSAEVVAEWGPLVQSLFPEETVIPVGYIDGVYGYLPRSAMLADGGYEAGGALVNFGLGGRFHTDLDDRIAATLAALAL